MCVICCVLRVERGVLFLVCVLFVVVCCLLCVVVYGCLWDDCCVLCVGVVCSV